MSGIFNHLYKAGLEKLLWVLVVLFSLALLAQVSELFLLHTGVNFEKKSSFVNRHLYRISGLFYEQNELVRGKDASGTQTKSEDASPLTSWSLQALYQEGNEGFAVVEVSKKTHFLNLGESLEGYKFTRIKDKNAYFNRSGKIYKLSLAVSSHKILDVATSSKKPKNIKVEHLDKSALKAGLVSREIINRRLKQPSLIWKDIRISIYKVRGEIQGFIVRSVAHNSVFHYLGLKRGDIIVSANGETFNSLDQVQELYKNIDKIQSLVLGIKRSGKIKEISYEIK